MHIARNEKVHSGGNTKGVAGQALHKEIIHNFNQQQKPEIEMRLQQQRHC